MAGGSGSPHLYQNADFCQQQILVASQKNVLNPPQNWTAQPSIKVTWSFYFGQSRVMKGCAYWESTNVKHSGFTMGKDWQISNDLVGFHCTNDDSCSRIDRVKKSSNAIPIGGCVQSCSNYCQFCSPRLLAVLPSFAHGDFWLVIVTSGLNTPAYWNGIRWILEEVNPAVTIIICAAEAI